MKSDKKIIGTREWAAHSANIAIGCPHDCRYCYARAIAMRYKIIHNLNDWQNTILKPPPKRLLKQVKGKIMFPTTHDITDATAETSLEFLEKTLKAGNKVIIVTKPHKHIIEMFCDVLKPFQHQILWRFTIGSLNDQHLSFWDRNAPLFAERLESLIIARTYGYETSVSVEPMLDCNMLQLYSVLKPYISHSIWFGQMNKIKERVDFSNFTKEDYKYYESVRFANTKTFAQFLYDNLKHHKIVKFKDSLRHILGLPLISNTEVEENQNKEA